jgi:hypothetical protein
VAGSCEHGNKPSGSIKDVKFKGESPPECWFVSYLVLRGIFGCKRDEVTGSWRKQHSEQLATENHVYVCLKQKYKDVGLYGNYYLFTVFITTII